MSGESAAIFVCGLAAVLRLILGGNFVDYYGVGRADGAFESCRMAASIGGAPPCGMRSGATAWLPPVTAFYLAFVALRVQPNQIYIRGLSFRPVAQETITAPPAAATIIPSRASQP